MNISLIQFAVQSIVRLGKVSQQAAEQSARNEATLLPGLDTQDVKRLDIINSFFMTDVNHKVHVADDGLLAEFWDNNRAKTDGNSVDSLYVAALRISADEGVDFTAALTLSGATLINQFDPGKGPISPFARVALVAADVVLDYLAIDPGIATNNANSQKLIGAFARNMADFLPDDGTFGPKERFGERLAAGFLRAGLTTVSAHPDWAVDGDHVEKLLENSLKPIVASFPASIADQIKWNRVTDSIIGPAAQAALETVAANQAEFFGSRFDPDIALGAVTQALLLGAAEDDLLDVLSQEGLIGLYQSVLGVAASRPELFIDGTGPKEELARDALSAFSNVLANTDPPFDRTAGIALASAAIEVVGTNAHNFADPGNEWHGVAVKVFEKFAKDLSDAVKTNKKLGQVLSREQLTEIGRIVMTEISTNPTLITKNGDEWYGVISAVTTAMAADTGLLLTGDDWKEIASVAAAEAATNPARLFKLDDQSNKVPAAKLIAVLLKGASSALKLPNGKERSVLAGTVLREAVTIALRAAAGNVKAIQDHLPLVEKLITQLNKLAVENHLEIGSKEWLHLFRALLGSVLDGTPVGDIDLERAVKLLQGG
jgi:hypothetical protein